MKSKGNIRDKGYLAAAVTVWVGIIGTGLLVLGLHAATPGVPAPAGIGPALTHGDVPASSDKLTLVMFLHPKCPCSVASLTELASLMEREAGRVHARVVMFQPSDRSDDWTRTATWAAASEITGVAVETDRDAALAKQLGARTSGQVFLFGRDGRLRFAGGITGARGHVGRNDSLDALTRLVEADPGTSPGSGATRTPVFGCAIYEGAEREVRSE